MKLVICTGYNYYVATNNHPWFIYLGTYEDTELDKTTLKISILSFVELAPLRKKCAPIFCNQPDHLLGDIFQNHYPELTP